MAEAEIRARPDRVINGWTFREHDLGTFVPAEVMTLSCEVDGAGRHELRFDPDDPPPVRAFRTRQQGTRFVVRFYEPQEALIDGSYRCRRCKRCRKVKVPRYARDDTIF